MAALGGYQTLVLAEEGTVLYQWGSSKCGKIMLNGPRSKVLPASSLSTPHQSTSWKAAACGFDHCSALNDDGEVWVWGSYKNGQLGQGSKQVG